MTTVVGLTAIAPTVVRPGDTLVVVIKHVTNEQAFNLKQILDKRLPGVATLVLQADALAVYRPDGDPT